MPRDPSPLAGCRVLIVEDEFTVLLMLEDVVRSFGCIVAETASNLAEAVIKARNSNVDVAILDINLRGSKVYPAAEILRDRNIPIVFSTGYGAAGLDPLWAQYVVIQKPFVDAGLAIALASALSFKNEGR